MSTGKNIFVKGKRLLRMETVRIENEYVTPVMKKVPDFYISGTLNKQVVY